MRFVLFSFIAFSFITGCIQTRSTIRGEKPSGGNPVFGTVPTAGEPSHTQEQVKAAEATSKASDIDEDFRKLYGRFEAVEGQLQAVKENEYVKSLEAKVVQLENKVALLETTVSDLNAKQKVAQAIPPAPANPLDAADKHFSEKKWEQAILSYEEYRKKHPKGDDYARATYRIGLSFQEMGLRGDAKAFYKEVVDKFPKSKEAGLAKTKLKKL